MWKIGFYIQWSWRGKKKKKKKKKKIFFFFDLNGMSTEFSSNKNCLLNIYDKQKKKNVWKIRLTFCLKIRTAKMNFLKIMP